MLSTAAVIDVMEIVHINRYMLNRYNVRIYHEGAPGERLPTVEASVRSCSWRNDDGARSNGAEAAANILPCPGVAVWQAKRKALSLCAGRTMTIGAQQLRERSADKNEARACLRESMARIEAQGRQPDMWERVCLAHGISALFRGQYSLAAIDAELALTPANRRSPQWKPPSNPVFARYDFRLLRAALADAEKEPVRPFPHFGPIVFASGRQSRQA